MCTCCPAATRTTSWRPSSRPSPARSGRLPPSTRGPAGFRPRRASFNALSGTGPCLRPGPDMTRRVVVLDYGSGNLRSAERALARAGADVTVTADLDAAAECDGLVVPGVGAFAACMAGLRGIGGEKVIASRLERGRPVL